MVYAFKKMAIMASQFIIVSVLRRLCVFGFTQPQNNNDVKLFLAAVFERIDSFLKSSKNSIAFGAARSGKM